MTNAQRFLPLLLVFGLPLAAEAQSKPKLDVPYVPTPEAVVERMLEMGQVGPKDVLYDLGSGDGRIVIRAAQKFGTKGIGVDIDPDRISEARSNAKQAAVEDKVEFRQGNLFEMDLSQATVITLYLLPTVNMQLRPKLQALRPGTRIVSHRFDMGDWKPDQVSEVDGTTVYLWIVKGKNGAGGGAGKR